jgi:hypothetical protein
MKFYFNKINAVFLIFLTLLFSVSFFEIDPQITSFIKTNFSLFIVIFLLSLSILIYCELIKFQKEKSKKFSFSNKDKDLIYSLSKLSYEEKNILSLFMDNKTQERPLNPNDQSVAWLENIKFIFNTGKVDGAKKIYRIEPTLSKHLSQNPNSLY